VLAFSQPGRFWKGNLHTHTNLSDGAYAPDEVARRYREAGYDFVSLTDHFLSAYDFPITDTRSFRTQTFTTIIGAELHTDLTEFGQIWHLLAVGLPDDFAPPSDSETVTQIARRAMDAGAYVAAAHPAWYSLTERDMEALGPVDAIEVYNGVAIDHNEHPDSWELADILLGRGLRYNICATDDYHGSAGREDFGRGWVQVKSETLEPAALLAALKAGHYYSSTGPEIHDIETLPGDRIRLRCSPASRVFVTGKGPASRALAGNGETEFEFDLSEFDTPYCRITVRGVDGGRAWTNPFYND
jgi:predicted metal-dependent phosphoesterase TrpH